MKEQPANPEPLPGISYYPFSQSPQWVDCSQENFRISETQRAKLSFSLELLRFHLSFLCPQPSITARNGGMHLMEFCFIVLSCAENPNLFVLFPRWSQILPVGMPVPTALQVAGWCPLKCHRTPQSSKKILSGKTVKTDTVTGWEAVSLHVTGL